MIYVRDLSELPIYLCEKYKYFMETLTIEQIKERFVNDVLKNYDKTFLNNTSSKLLLTAFFDTYAKEYHRLELEKLSKDNLFRKIDRIMLQEQTPEFDIKECLWTIKELLKTKL